MSKSKRVFTPEEEAAIIARYQADEAIRDIAKDYHMADKPIRDVLLKHNIPLRRERTDPNAKAPTPIPALDPGLTPKERAARQLASYYKSEVRR